MFEQMPAHLGWRMLIAHTNEPGESLEISGRILYPDGKTPAPNVILYVYHTDARGYYTPDSSQTGWARRHGRLRGWMRTNERGEYAFRTIRPAPYPGGMNPAHIHPIIKEPDRIEYYVDEYLFTDDPILKKMEHYPEEKRGGSGIMTLTKGKDGTWRGRRDIVLGLNVPNYPRRLPYQNGN